MVRMAKSAVTDKQREFKSEALPHMDFLYNYALRMTYNAADAEDLVQETFMKAFRFWDSYEQGTNIRAWLFRIMKNAYINRYRKEKKEPETVEYQEVENFYTSLSGGVVETSDSQEAMFNNLLEDDVSTAIAELPEDFRTVVILCDIEELKYEEVAEFLECPIGTVRSRLHRGRKLLRTKLFEYAKKRGFVEEK
jgi:RNA polymerase sigma-70 factor (ECF subfamily)